MREARGGRESEFLTDLRAQTRGTDFPGRRLQEQRSWQAPLPHPVPTQSLDGASSQYVTCSRGTLPPSRSWACLSPGAAGPLPRRPCKPCQHAVSLLRVLQGLGPSSSRGSPPMEDTRSLIKMHILRVLCRAALASLSPRSCGHPWQSAGAQNRHCPSHLHTSWSGPGLAAGAPPLCRRTGPPC